jgi:hypothetical protein
MVEAGSSNGEIDEMSRLAENAFNYILIWLGMPIVCFIVGVIAAAIALSG